jgi:hypothetical protein
MDGKPVTIKNDPWGRGIVGFLLVILSVSFVGGLLWRLLDGSFAGALGKTMVDPAQVNEALIMIFAGGVGSSVYAIRAYLIHACDKKDFDRAFIPWYIFWIFQGSLLGLIFYFAVRGGILLITIKSGAQAGADLNTWSLAAIGALGGLFSKYAIEKLRQVFIVMFTSVGKDDEALQVEDNKKAKN